MRGHCEVLHWRGCGDIMEKGGKEMETAWQWCEGYFIRKVRFTILLERHAM